MKIEIKSRFTGQIIISGQWETLRKCVEESRANLYGANLSGADLGGANLSGADLGGANLRRANLWGADLQEANLWEADLWEANLRSANLGGANLGGANLYGANLYGADLRGARDYGDSHDMFAEIIRRQEISFFTSVEWYAIGVITVHHICWTEIKRQFADVIGGVFEKLAKVGFDEWLKYWRKINEQA